MSESYEVLPGDLDEVIEVSFSAYQINIKTASGDQISLEQEFSVSIDEMIECANAKKADLNRKLLLRLVQDRITNYRIGIRMAEVTFESGTVLSVSSPGSGGEAATISVRGDLYVI